MLSNLNIKRIALWLFIIMVLAFGTAGLIFAAEGFTGIFTGIKSQDINTDKTLSMDNIKNVYIDVVSEDVNIIPADSKDIKVHFYGSYSSSKAGVPELKVQNTQGKLNIKVTQPIVVGLNFRNSDLKLDIYLPKSYSESVSINTVSGDLNIEGFDMDGFNFSSVSGNLNALSLSTKDSGMNTTSGDAVIKGFCGNLRFSSVSGDIDIKYSNFNSNLKINTTSGESKIKLPESSGFSLKFDSVSGSTHSNFPLSTKEKPGSHHSEALLGNGTNRIEVNTVSGDLDISR